MLKQLKRYGNNLVVVFTTEEEKMFGMKEGDKIDLSDLFLIDAKYKPLPRNQTKKMIKEKIKNDK